MPIKLKVLIVEIYHWERYLECCDPILNRCLFSRRILHVTLRFCIAALHILFLGWHSTSTSTYIYRAPRLYATDHMEFLPIFRRLSSQFSSYDYNYIGICQTHKHSNKYHLNLGHASALIREFIRITGNKSLGNHASSYWFPL